MGKVLQFSDEVLTTTIHDTGYDELTGVVTQPSQNMILKRNQELRNNPGALRDLSFGSLVASIPFVDYFGLRQKYPELRSPDAKIRSKKMIQILKSLEGAEYLVKNKKQGRI